MNDTELGQKILTAIKQVCAEQKEEVKYLPFVLKAKRQRKKICTEWN